MKQRIYAYLIDIIQLFVTSLVSFLTLSSFFGMIEYIYPIRNQILSGILATFQIPCTSKNVVILLSAACIVIPALLHRTSIMKSYLLWFYDCRRPTVEEKDRLERAMTFVCEKIRDDIRNYDLYVSEINDDNAFSMGGNIIIVTKKLLDSTSVSTYAIAGLLAHEVGHIKNHHNHTYLMTNMVAKTGYSVIQIYSTLGDILSELTGLPFLGFLVGILSWCFKLLSLTMILVLGFPERTIACRNFHRKEYEADTYACRIGMGCWLFEALKYVTRNETDQDCSFSTHPAPEKRLKRIADYIVSQERRLAKI